MSSAPRSSSAKRSASGNLSNSSDDEQDDQVRDVRDTQSLVSTSMSSAGTSDFDASSSTEANENPCSPGGSSTSSGPVYIRPPGFQYHAQQITRSRIKKKKKVFPTYSKQSITTESLRKAEPIPPKHRQTKRDPLPMRMRAFPQSFWQQPNEPVGISPAHCHKVLPPLSIKDEIDMVRPVTPPDDIKLLDNSSTTVVQSVKEKINPIVTNKSQPKVLSESKVTVNSNAETMLSKLFENVDDKANVSSKKTELNLAPGVSYRPVPPSVGNTRKGRPKNIFSCNKTMLHGCDPYMMDTIADKLFPHLTLEKSGVKSYHTVSSTGGNTSLQLITLREGDKSVTLPSLCVEQNYSQMLSELVPHL